MGSSSAIERSSRIRTSADKLRKEATARSCNARLVCAGSWTDTIVRSPFVGMPKLYTQRPGCAPILWVVCSRLGYDRLGRRVVIETTETAGVPIGTVFIVIGNRFRSPRSASAGSAARGGGPRFRR